jgi:hypothetical protein
VSVGTTKKSTYHELMRMPRMQQRLLELGLVRKPVTEREKRRIVREKRAEEIARLMSRYDRGALYEQVWSQPCSLVSWCPPTVPRSVAQQKSLDRLVVRAVSGAREPATGRALIGRERRACYGRLFRQLGLCPVYVPRKSPPSRPAGASTMAG